MSIFASKHVVLCSGNLHTCCSIYEYCTVWLDDATWRKTQCHTVNIALLILVQWKWTQQKFLLMCFHLITKFVPTKISSYTVTLCVLMQSAIKSNHSLINTSVKLAILHLIYQFDYYGIKPIYLLFCGWTCSIEIHKLTKLRNRTSQMWSSGCKIHAHEHVQ